MIKDIIQTINNGLTTAKGSGEIRINGLCQTVFSEEKEAPFIVENGEDEYPYIDDDYDMGLFHRINNKTYSNISVGGFGDNYKTICTADISCYIWGKERVLSAEDAENWFIKNTPSNVQIISTNFNKKQNFDAEFKGYDYDISEDYFFIKITYKVDFKINRECLNDIFNN